MTFNSRKIIRSGAPLLALPLIFSTLVLPFFAGHASAYNGAGQGVSVIHARLNPDLATAVVKAKRHLHYMDGTPDTYTMTRKGSEFVTSDMKVPLLCDSTQSSEQGRFDVYAYASDGTTEIGNYTNGAFGINVCGGDSKTVTVNTTIPSRTNTNTASICGTLTYTDPGDNSVKPWQANSTLNLTGTKSITTHTDSAGKYCFSNLPAGTYNVDGTYVYTDSSGIPTSASYSKRGIVVAKGQKVTASSPAPAAPATTGTTKTASTGGTNSSPACESSALSWIICPVVDGLSKSVDGIYGNLIQPLLETNPIDVTGEAPTDPTDQDKLHGYQIYSVWSEFRVFGDIFLIIALLVIVFGQTIGGGLFDAYTAKKVLPRLLIAAVLINLSIYIVALLVDLTNILGNGIASILEAPFKNTDSYKLMFSGSTAFGAGTALVASAVGLFAAAAVFQFTLLMFLIPVFLTFLAIFVTVILRQSVIMLLVLISPVAFALYCLPNTEQYFRRWWKLLVEALLVYPIIATLFALGRVMSVVINSGGGKLSGFLSIVAFVAPLFFIPFAFKLAGGIIGGLHGFAVGKAGGFSSRMAKRRQEKMGQRTATFKAGSTYQDRGLGKAINSIGRRSSVGVRGRYGFGKRGAGALDIQSRVVGAEAQKDAIMGQLQFDDDGIMAMALSGGSASAGEAALKKLGWKDDRISKAMGAAKSVGVNRANAVAAIDMMARNKSFSLPGGPAGIEAVVAAADRIGGVQRNASGAVISGNKALSDNLMGSFEFNSRQAGRMDLGMHDYATGKADFSKAWSKASLSQHAQSAGPSLGVFADKIKADLKSKDVAVRSQAAVQALEMQNMLPYAVGANQDTINGLMSDLKIDFGSKQSVEQQLAQQVNFDTATGQQLADVKASELRGYARVYDQPDRYDAEGKPMGQTP